MRMLLPLTTTGKDSQQNAIENTGLQPPNNLDAAISVTLAAGNYTAVVTGKDGSTGVALVEVYATQYAIVRLRQLRS
jgi:hypothetical protein